MRTVMVALVGVILLQGCALGPTVGKGSGKTIIEAINAGRAIASVTRDGVTERAINCTKDIFDPGNRGSGCHR